MVKTELLNSIIKSFKPDKNGVITREGAVDARQTIENFKLKLIENYPSKCTKKLRESDTKLWQKNLTILRQVLLHHNLHLHASRKSVWNSEKKCVDHLYSYKIV